MFRDCVIQRKNVRDSYIYFLFLTRNQRLTSVFIIIASSYFRQTLELWLSFDYLFLEVSDIVWYFYQHFFLLCNSSAKFPRCVLLILNATSYRLTNVFIIISSSSLRQTFEWLNSYWTIDYWRYQRFLVFSSVFVLSLCNSSGKLPRLLLFIYCTAKSAIDNCFYYYLIDFYRFQLFNNSLYYSLVEILLFLYFLPIRQKS